MVVVDWITAPSASPWKLTTNGLGIAAPALATEAVLTGVGDGTAGEGVLTRYHRVAPSTSTVRRWLVRGPAWARAQPDEGTGAASSTAVEGVRSAGEVVLVEAVPEDEQLTQRTTTARATAATGADLLIGGVLIIREAKHTRAHRASQVPLRGGTAARPTHAPGRARRAGTQRAVGWGIASGADAPRVLPPPGTILLSGGVIVRERSGLSPTMPSTRSGRPRLGPVCARKHRLRVAP